MYIATYDMIVSKMTENLGVDASRVRPDATFYDLDLDSLAALELGVIVEEDLGVSFDLDKLKCEEMTLISSANISSAWRPKSSAPR